MDALYEPLVFPASCQINWLAAAGPCRGGWKVRGCWDHGKPCQSAQQGTCVSHYVIFSVPLLLEQTCPDADRGVQLKPFIKHCPVVSEQVEPRHGYYQRWHLVILND